MAKISHCGRWVRAVEYRVLSAKPAYKYQRLYCAVCSKCKKRVRYWCGEFPNGQTTALIEVTAEEYAEHWKKRIKKEKPKPPIQMTSDYTIYSKSGNIEKQIKYQAYLDRKRRMPLKDTP